MSFSCVMCCVLSGRCLYDGLITCSEESYRVCVCMCVCVSVTLSVTNSVAVKVPRNTFTSSHCSS
jgi:hypothetical protein